MQNNTSSPTTTLDELLHKDITLPFGVVTSMLLNARRSVFKSVDDDPNFNDWVYVDSPLAILLRAFDPNSLIVHVEMPGDLYAPDKLEMPRVWNIRAWNDSHDRRVRLKARQDRAREQMQKRDELIVRLARALIGQSEFTYELSVETAIEYVMHKRVGLCMMYDVDIRGLDDDVTCKCILDKIYLRERVSKIWSEIL